MKKPISRIVYATKNHPDEVITNADLEKMVDTSDEWIRSRTGITERRRAAAGMGVTDICIPAVEDLLEKTSMKREDIDGIVFATTTPDQPTPSAACILQDKIGTRNAWGLDINGACSGFLYAVTVADSLIKNGLGNKLLVIGADICTRFVDYEDRNTCVLFGDGAGVTLMVGDEIETSEKDGVIDNLMGSDGSGRQSLCIKAGGSVLPASIETLEKKQHFVFQDGKTVFKTAVKAMADISEEILTRNGFTSDDMCFLIAHQANRRIIEAAANRLKIPEAKVVYNLDRYGNTTAATIPTCLAELIDKNRLNVGDLVVLSAFGAGFTWAANLVRFG